MKRLATAVLITVVASAGSLAASPAMAAAYTPTCTADTTVPVSGTSHTFTVGAACDTFTWSHGVTTSTSDYTVTLTTSGGTTPVNPNASPVGLSTGDVVSFTYSGPTNVSGGARLNFTSLTPTTDEYLITVGSGGGGSSSSTTSGSAPAPVVQQFGMPATGTCDEAQPEGLNWSGVAGGGWGISWAQWMNDGAGGPVCSRELVYSTAQSKWVVN